MAFGVMLMVVGMMFGMCVGETFNFEVARRTHDRVESFLHAMTFPTKQISEAFSLQILNVSSPSFYKEARLLSKSLLNAVPQIGALYIMFPELLVSVIRSDNMLLTSEPVFGANCSTPLAAGDICVRFAIIDLDGNPVSLVGTQPLNLQAAGIVQQYASRWSPVMPLSLTEIGVEYAAPINDSSGTTIGFASAGVMISNIDTFLFNAFGAEPDNRVVYIMERTTGKLVSASVQGITTTVQGGRVAQVLASECSNTLIKESSVFLFTLSDLQKEVVYVHNGYYVQNTQYSAVGIDWLIVVVRPADMQKDYISPGSSTYLVLCVICGLCATVALCLMVWVIRFRKLRLWKAGQPEALLMVLVANVACIFSAISILGAPDDTNCMLRQWSLPLAITMTCSSLIAKLLRVFLTTNTQTILKRTTLRRLTAKHVMAIVTITMAMQIVYLALWTAFDPFHSTLEYNTQSGIVVGRKVCASSSIAWVAGNASCVLVFLVAGCYLSFVTRNVSELFAESRALMTIFFHGAFIGALLVFVAILSNISRKSITALLVVALLWFTVTTQIALFFPRIYRQVTLGDFSMWEMKEFVVQHLKRADEKNSQTSQVRFFLGDVRHQHSSTTVDPPQAEQQQFVI